MVRQFLLSITLFVPSAYASMCGESDGIVKCTDDAGRNPTLQTLDKALVSPSGVTARPDYSVGNPEMATYPRDPKSGDKPIRSESESKESTTTPFITTGDKTER
jgi:hypothetical protein